MTCNLDIIAQIAMNGYKMIPAIPGEKQTYYKWGTVTRNNYNFSEIFKRQPENCNAAILCEDDIAVVDLDSHGSEPNGRTIYENLEPEVYKGCIVEESQSGGIHLYYRGVKGSNRFGCWLPGYNSYESLDDPFKMRVETAPAVLSGRTLCYCYPTITPKGSYRMLSKETLLNTRPDQLPPLHWIWQFKNPYQDIREKTAYDKPVNARLTQKQIEYSIEAAKESRYRVGTGWRHHEAIAFAGEILSLGISESEAESHVVDYIEHLRPEGLAYPNEAKDIVRWASRKTGSPIIRFKGIREREKKEAYKNLAKIFGGKKA